MMKEVDGIRQSEEGLTGLCQPEYEEFAGLVLKSCTVWE